MSPTPLHSLRLLLAGLLLAFSAACAPSRPPAPQPANSAEQGFPPPVEYREPSQRARPERFDPDRTAILLNEPVLKALDPRSNFALGVDVLKREDFRRLDHRHVLVVTNRLALDGEGNHLLELLLPLRKPIVRRVVLFNDELPPPAASPAVERILASYPDVRVFERNPANFRLTPGMYDDVDLILVDMPLRAGAFHPEYGFLGGVIEDAALRRLEVLVLDRPHPVNGIVFEGPPADPGNFGNASSFRPGLLLPGLTPAEYLRMLNGRFGMGARLEVVSMENWDRRAALRPVLDTYTRLGIEPWRGLEEWEEYLPADPLAGQLRLLRDLLPSDKFVRLQVKPGEPPFLVLRSAPMAAPDFCSALQSAGVPGLSCTVGLEADNTVLLNLPRLLDSPVTNSVAIWSVYAKADPGILPGAGQGAPFNTTLVFELLREGRDAPTIQRLWQGLGPYQELETWRQRSLLY